MVKLVDDHQTHPLNVAADLENPARRERTLALLKELADGETLKDGTLDTYLRDNPGTGPVFEHVDSNVNQSSDGSSRKQAFVDECKEQYSERAVGPEPTPSEREAVQAYASDLSEKVEAEVEREVSAICPPGATFSVRTKSAAGLFDKVGRMTESGRATYEVGDVIDAVGARITVEDMPQLASALKTAEQRLGTGDGGRILEIENMYADPKSRSPEYRVIPMIVRVDVDGKPYTYELQLTTRRASVAADVGHNTIYKHYHELTDTQHETIKKMQSEAAALDQEETRR
jgi:ppGpp synthetase/RelA/SpoT-type nucleotidyltranferase